MQDLEDYFLNATFKRPDQQLLILFTLRGPIFFTVTSLHNDKLVCVVFRISQTCQINFSNQLFWPQQHITACILNFDDQNVNYYHHEVADGQLS